MFQDNGPTLYFHIINQLFTATFSNAQGAQDNLAKFHPKQYKYDIVQVNNFIHAVIKMLKAASSLGGTIMDQEILYFQLKIYKCIKVPVEWTSHILFLEAMVASTPTYSPDTLFNEVQSKFTNLTNQGLWCLSDITPEEQTLVMVAQQQQQNKPRATQKENKSKLDNKQVEKKVPPFANAKGKLSNTKQWNSKTYYFCPANHKHSHWHAGRFDIHAQVTTMSRFQVSSKERLHRKATKDLWLCPEDQALFNQVQD